MERKKVFYRKLICATYNGVCVDKYHYNLEYGYIPDDSECFVFDDYDEVISALEDGRITINTWYVDKPFLSKKKCLYEISWYERFKISRKDFKKLCYVETYEKVQPSLEDIVKDLPVDFLLEWLDDNVKDNKELYRILRKKIDA